MSDAEQKPILMGLGALAVGGGIAWAWVLANRPEPEVLPPEPVQVRRIACDAPVLNLEADGHLRDVTVQGDRVEAVVASDAGTALWRDAQGVARLQLAWKGAEPGETVPCEAAIPSRSRVQGRIEGLRPALLISACSDGLVEVVDGRFEVETILGHPCSYWLMDDTGAVVARIQATAEPSTPLVLAVH